VRSINHLLGDIDGPAFSNINVHVHDTDPSE